MAFFGFSALIPSIITGVGYVASAVLLAIALKQLPLGTAYAMWTGMGIVGTTLLGVFLFHEKLSVPQVICVILIIVGKMFNIIISIILSSFV